MYRLIIVLLSINILITSCHHPQEEKLNIAVAANMQFAMKEIARAFTEKTGIDCQLMISSSGKLTAQIKEGAPYDILVSANMKYPQDLYSSGYTELEPKVYAFGSLILWSLKDEIQASMDILSSAKIKHIAMANPKMAPYGIAALEALRYYELEESLKNKLVFGESVAQCNQFIISTSAEIGFTEKSVIFSPEMKGQGSWIAIDTASYSPIAQGIVLIQQENRNKKLAQVFYAFIFSQEAREILVKFGYSVKDKNDTMIE